jgi:hypothetical protein
LLHEVSSALRCNPIASPQQHPPALSTPPDTYRALLCRACPSVHGMASTREPTPIHHVLTRDDHWREFCPALQFTKNNLKDMFESLDPRPKQQLVIIAIRGFFNSIPLNNIALPPFLLTYLFSLIRSSIYLPHVSGFRNETLADTKPGHY